MFKTAMEGPGSEGRVTGVRWMFKTIVLEQSPRNGHGWVGSPRAGECSKWSQRGGVHETTTKGPGSKGRVVEGWLMFKTTMEGRSPRNSHEGARFWRLGHQGPVDVQNSHGGMKSRKFHEGDGFRRPDFWGLVDV